MPSCSAAAARKVSPAAITTFEPSAASRAPTLPMVVVLPTPFTPTNSQTVGPVSSERWRSRSKPLSLSFSSPFSASSSCGAVGDAVGLHPGPEVVEEILGGDQTDIGEQEGLFELLPGVLVDLGPPADRAERPGQGVAGLREAIAEPGLDEVELLAFLELLDDGTGDGIAVAQRRLGELRVGGRLELVLSELGLLDDLTRESGCARRWLEEGRVALARDTTRPIPVPTRTSRATARMITKTMSAPA